MTSYEEESPHGGGSASPQEGYGEHEEHEIQSEMEDRITGQSGYGEDEEEALGREIEDDR